MSAQKLISAALVVVGGILLYLGYQTSQGAASQVGEVFTGRPSDAAIYYYIGGAVCVVLGLGGVAFLKRKR